MLYRLSYIRKNHKMVCCYAKEDAASSQHVWSCQTPQKHLLTVMGYMPNPCVCSWPHSLDDGCF